MTFRPTAPLVAVAWLSQRVPGVDAARVATRLPRVTDWAAEGFVQATVIPSAAPVHSGDGRLAYVQVDCWGVNLAADGSAQTKPAIKKAAVLAENVLAATGDDVQAFGRPIAMPANYGPVRVLSVYPMTEPSEVSDDPSGFGRVTLDLAIKWSPL